MSVGEGLTRGTAWLALTLYVGGEVLRCARLYRDPGGSVARWLNTLGCAALLTHVGCAFHFHHDWSHAAAYADTARQTQALTGWNWGGGVYVNYFFAAAWLVRVLRSWRGPGSFRTCSPAMNRCGNGGIAAAADGLGGRDAAVPGSWEGPRSLRIYRPRTELCRRVGGPGPQLEAQADARGGSRATASESWLFRAFFLFMFLNGAVIFVPGPAKWFGLACCLALVVVWVRPGRRTA